MLPVVVLSNQALLLLDVLRSELSGCLPLSVPSVDDVKEQASPGAVILIDLGEGDVGATAARKLRDEGVQQGIVVVGDTVIDDLSAVVVVQPPFRLGDLVDAFEELREDGGSEQKVDEATSGSGDTPATTTVPRPPPSASPLTSAPATAEPQGTTPASNDDAARTGTEESALHRGQSREAVRLGPAQSVPELARAAAASADPDLLSGHPPSHPGAGGSGGRGGGTSMRGSLDRWRKRVGAATQSLTRTDTAEEELYQRLVTIFEATSRMETIIEQFPMVTRRAALYGAVVEAVAEEFRADTVGLWRKHGNGWIVAAHHGFTPRQAHFPVSLDQPLLSEIETTAGAILLDPVSGFQTLVDGVGGVQTESMMAACVAVGSRRFGILTVGRDLPLVEEELDRFVEMAVEAAVGIGIADHIHDMAKLSERRQDRGGAGGGVSGELQESLFEEASAPGDSVATEPKAATAESPDAGREDVGGASGAGRVTGASGARRVAGAGGGREDRLFDRPQPAAVDPGVVIDLRSDAHLRR